MNLLKNFLYVTIFILSSNSYAVQEKIEIKVHGLHADNVKEIEHNGVLFSGDSFQLEVSVNHGQHIYSFLLDSLNELTNMSSSFEMAGASYKLPANNHWYKLDDNIGTEKLIVVGSNSPLDVGALSSAIKNGNWSLKIFDNTTVKISNIRHMDPKVITRGIQIINNQGARANKTELQDLKLLEIAVLPEKNVPVSGVIRSLVNFSNVLPQETRGIKEVHVFKKSAPAVVKVFTKKSSGSGSLISKEGLILTNWHVVKNSKKVGIAFMPKIRNKVTKDDLLTGRVIKINGESDLALIKLDTPPKKIKPLLISNESPEIGQDVHAIGHPKGGSDWTYTKGYISQLNYNDNWSYKETAHNVALMIQSQTPINPGNSGGPLLNNSGKIVGVNSSSSLDYASANYAISAEDVRAFLDQKGNISTKAREKKVKDKAKLKNKKSNLEEISRKLGFNVIAVEIVDYTEDGSKDFKISIDDDKNGLIEMTVIILEDKDKGRIIIYDNNEDGIPDEMALDEDNNGKTDTHLYINKEKKVDVIGYDDDEDGTVDRYEDYK